MTTLPKLHAVITVIMLVVACIGCDRSAKPVISKHPEENFPDVTLVYEISSDTTIQRVNFKLKGTRARTDTEEGLFSTIHDPEKGTTFLDHKKKSYQTMQLDLPDNSKMSSKTAVKLASAWEMRFTGKTKKIGEWECKEYVLFDSFGKGFPEELQSRFVGWITDDLKGGAAIQAQKDKVAPSQLLKWMAATTSKDIAFPGFAVRTENTQNGQYPFTSTCIKVSYDTLDSQEFEIPSTYTDKSPQKIPNNHRMGNLN